MFTNVGGKIKVLAQVICWIGIIASVLGAISLFVTAADAWGDTATMLTISGIALLIGGSLVSWLGSLFTYGYGELIEQTAEINDRLRRRN